MKCRMYLGVLATIASLLLSAPVWAHHSFAAVFTVDKPITITGTITELRWINPHCYIQLDAKDASGKVERWDFEFGAPVALRRMGMKQEMVAPGTVVTIKGFRAKKENINLGWVSTFIFANGFTISITADRGEDLRNR